MLFVNFQHCLKRKKMLDEYDKMLIDNIIITDNYAFNLLLKTQKVHYIHTYDDSVDESSTDSELEYNYDYY